MIRHLRLVQLMGLVGLATLAIVGCSGDEHPRPAPYEDSSAPDTTAEGAAVKPKSFGSCEELQVRECRVILGAQGSVQNCFVGLQLCTDGEWGPCLDPSEIELDLNAR